MTGQVKESTIAKCLCGKVELELTGKPIISAACYCDDCQAGSRQIEALPGAPPVLGKDGGTAYTLYRKDRARYLSGEDLLKNYKIREKTATNRVVATCCNSAMVLSFEDSRHWVSVFQRAFQENQPTVEMRICTKFKPENTVLSDNIPNYSTF